MGRKMKYWVTNSYIFDQLTKEIDFFFPTSLRQRLRIFLYKNFPNLGDTYSQKLCFGAFISDLQLGMILRATV